MPTRTASVTAASMATCWAGVAVAHRMLTDFGTEKVTS